MGDLGEGAALAASAEATLDVAAFPFALSVRDAASSSSPSAAGDDAANDDDDAVAQVALWAEKTRQMTDRAEVFAERVAVLEKILARHARRFAARAGNNIEARLLGASWLAAIHGEHILRSALRLGAQRGRRGGLDGGVSELSRRYARRVLGSSGAGPLAQAVFEHPLRTTETRTAIRIFAASLAGIAAEDALAAVQDSANPGSLPEAILAHMQQRAQDSSKDERPEQAARSKATMARHRELVGLAVSLAAGGNLDAVAPSSLPQDVVDVIVDVVATTASLETRRARGLQRHALLQCDAKKESNALRKVDLTRAAQELEAEVAAVRHGLLESVAWIADELEP